MFERAKEAKELRKETNRGWVYIKLEDDKPVIVSSTQFHDEIEFEFIASFTPDSILRDDYGIYKGAELTISKIINWVNEDYLISS